MHNINRPSVSAAEAYAAAVATIRSKADKEKYAAVSSAVATCCENFDLLAADVDFHSSKTSKSIVPNFSEDAMVDLYDKQFVRNKGTKKIREAILNAAPNGLCPYCGQGSVHELDHYLPKRPFSGTTVHPANLVPSCRDCNREKLDYAPSQNNPAVLHPYFDSAFGERWLHASIVRVANGQPAAKYEVRLASEDGHLQSRLECHMRVLGLYRRFRVFASQALYNFESLMSSQGGHAMTLVQAVDHLKLTAEQQSGGRVNSWEFAIFEAMANDEWYLASYLKLS